MWILTNERAKKWAVTAVFALLFLGGLLIAGDYGVSWDESTETEILVSNLKYAADTLLPKSVVDESINPVMQLFYSERVLSSPPAIINNVERDHGQAVYYPSAAVFFIIYGIRQADPSFNVEHGLYYFRHIYNFLVCFSGFLCLYFLVKKLTKRRAFGLFCVAALLLSPRFLADTFYNNKDMIAFITCIWMMTAVYRFYEKESLASAILAGVISAFAINTRVSLALFPVLAVIYYIAVKMAGRDFRLRSAGHIAAAIAAIALTYYIITPAAWKDPAGLLKYILDNAVYFSRWNGYVYYFGKVYHPSDIRLPIHYLPVMISVTTPVFILVLMLIGLCRLVMGAGNLKGLRLDSGFGFVLLAAAFSLISLLVPMIMKSNVYNGWRHLYYIYSGFLLVSVWGLKWLYSFPQKGVKMVVTVCLIAQTVSVTGWMTSNHPYEYAYYNMLAGAHPEERFELDYWNTSQASLIKQALGENGSGKVCIFYTTSYCATIKYAGYFLTDEEKGRLKLYNIDKLQSTNTVFLRNNPAYLIINPTTARKMVLWGKPLYLSEDHLEYDDLNPENEVIVDGSSIQQLYRLNEEQVQYLIREHM